MTDTSPGDCPFAAAVAVATTILTVDVDVGFTVSKERYSVLTPIHCVDHIVSVNAIERL